MNASRTELPSAPRNVPLSFAQERLWYLDQVQERPTYNRPANVRITGPLNLPALEQSLTELLDRHESLRMRFLERGPSVEIAALPLEPMELVDLSDQADPGSAAEELARVEASRRFDLQAGPPIRLRLLRLDSDEHLLLCTLHHIVFDGWSQNILMRELAELYQANCLGRGHSLRQLEVQYTDIAIRQRQRLEEGRLDNHIEYWRQQLSGPAQPLRIPTDYIRPANASEDGSRHTFHLSDSLTRQLRELNKAHRVTLFMTLFGAFQALLYHYTRQTSITTGTPIAGRTHKDMEDLIGLFINTLPLRIDLSENPTFTELTARVRRASLEAFQHQDVPLQTIVEEAVPERTLANSPLFETLFNLQQVIEPVHVEGVTFSVMNAKTATAKADLSMDLKYSADKIYGELEYRSELFAPSTIEKLATHWMRILEQVVENPSIQLDDLELLDQTDREKLVVTWNQTETDYPSGGGVHELFEDQVRRTPDKIAVATDNVQLSYSELDRRASQLANFLIEKANPQRVALLAERSVEMVVGILGILKSGACYIPIDATTPVERIRFILSETQSTLLTTHQRLKSALGESTSDGSTDICFERDENLICQAPSARPATSATGNDLAYIIFTSGSTGEPKGVMVEHHSVVNYARTIGDVLEVTDQDRVLQFASIGFDASVEEIFGALTTGATLVLRDESSINSISHFLDRLAQWEITFVSLPTAFWHEMAHQMHANSWPPPSCLKTVVIGGQKASSSALRAWQAAGMSHIHLFNTYGPTETTVVTTIAQWAGRKVESRRELSIGRPIPNSRAYVLDANRRPVPVGVPGELYVAGRGVARGYFNRPALTDEVFMPCPFDFDSDTRMYRTGDRVRWLDDGQLEFLDRVDNQVKVRGFRVEPEEIASNLESLAGVQQSVVVAREDESDEVQLVAYVVAATSPAPTPRDLRRALARQLPDYMIPGDFVFLDTIELNASGKVDEEALPRPKVSTSQTRDKQPLQTELQRQLADIWQEILGARSIGLDDQFFELGGHSLKAMQMIARLADRFGVDLPVRLIFQKPSLAEMAEEIERRQRTTPVHSAQKKLPSIAAISRERRKKTA